MTKLYFLLKIESNQFIRNYILFLLEIEYFYENKIN